MTHEGLGHVAPQFLDCWRTRHWPCQKTTSDSATVGEPCAATGAAGGHFAERAGGFLGECNGSGPSHERFGRLGALAAGSVGGHVAGPVVTGGRCHGRGRVSIRGLRGLLEAGHHAGRRLRAPAEFLVFPRYTRHAPRRFQSPARGERISKTDSPSTS